MSILATDRQVSYLTSLLSTRIVPTDILATVAAGVAALPRQTVSTIIDTLVRAPYAPRTTPAPAPAPATSELRTALENIPKSKYALPAGHTHGATTDLNITNDLLFLEVREYRGTLYMRQLHGAPGGFYRTRISTRDAIALATLIATRPVEYIQKFGQHYTCCGKCGADLTDAASRARVLGPECARQLGVA
jgi:hypothetical protein